MAALKGIVFDKDGTLYDFNATWGTWAYGLLQEESAGDDVLLQALAAELRYDLEARRFEKDSVVIAGTADEVAALLLPYLNDVTPSALIARMNARAASAPQVEAVPLDGFLRGLGEKGLRLGVATNDSELPARAHLASSGVEGLFDFIAGYDSGFGAKPAPGQLLAFCEAVGLAPSECVMVGDSTHDLIAGEAAGMKRVAVLTGLAEADELRPFADVVLASIADLPVWLAEQN